MNATNETTRDRLTVTLIPVGNGPPAEIRWRRVLKVLLRGYGLKAEWTTNELPQPPAEPAGDPHE